MKILVACDKFKGSINANQLVDCIASELEKHSQSISCIRQPLADGGDGTLTILSSFLDLMTVEVETIDPLGRDITTTYLSDGTCAYIELAKASGIVHLSTSELDIMKATTLGTGRLISHAIARGHTEIVLSIGGSCTNDLGLGIVIELGYMFFDHNDNELIPCGGNLHDIKDIVSPISFPNVAISILCDVSNPLYGPQGAASVYGPQKGASPDQVIQLNKSMMHIATLIQNKWGRDISTFEGAGAAGGVAAGLYGLLDNVEVMNGFTYLADLVSLEDKIHSADYVISGEGMLDSQSFQGKVVGRLSDLCKKYKKPLILIVGANNIGKDTLNIDAIYEVRGRANSEKDSFENVVAYIKLIVGDVFKMHLQ